MTSIPSLQRRTDVASRAALLSASYLALGLFAGIGEVQAQSSASSEKQLPAVEVAAPPEAKRRTAATSSAQRADRNAQRRRSQAARPPQAETAPKAFGQSQDARTGTVGIYANSTSIATKTNTPLLDIPQSISVVTKDFIRDQGFQSLTDVTRYVPGVAIHQGEGKIGRAHV